MVKSENGSVELRGDIKDIAADIGILLTAVNDMEHKHGLSDASFTKSECSFYMLAAFIAFYRDELDMKLVDSKIGAKHIIVACETLIDTLLSVYGKEKTNGR